MKLLTVGLLIIALGCRQAETPKVPIPTPQAAIAPQPDSLVYDDPNASYINTGITTPAEIVAFAQTLKGIPYKYASCTKESGFDCSGFVYYVFDNFHISVPRSSSAFTNLGKTVLKEKAKPGDLILFTGTNPAVRSVGHIGIVLSNENDSLVFIHSSSGEANSVTVTPLNDYYQGRFLKVIRVFRQNEPAN